MANEVLITESPDIYQRLSAALGDDEILKQLKPGSLTIGPAVDFPEKIKEYTDVYQGLIAALGDDEILKQLRPGKLTIGGVPPEEIMAMLRAAVTPTPQKPGGKLSQPLPSTKEIVDKFLVAKQVKVRPASLKSYSDTLRPFARRYPTLPAKPEQIEEYLAPYGNENTTAKNIYIIIRLLYNFAEKRNLLPFPNPITTVDKPGGKPKPPEHATINQAQALCKAIGDDRERALIYCLFGQGLRLKEARLLTVADVGQDTILVHGKEREEPMPLIPEIREALLKLTDGKRPEDYIFQGRNGKPLSDSMIQLIIKKLFAKAGITGVRPSPHTLRHSRGVITDIAGLDSYSSRRLLRHTTTQMTDRYSALNLDELRAKEERYNPLRVLSRLEQELGKKPDCAQC